MQFSKALNKKRVKQFIYRFAFIITSPENINTTLNFNTILYKTIYSFVQKN